MMDRGKASLEITFHTSSGKEYMTRVDIHEASKNSIAQAFMDSLSGAELINAFINSLLQGVNFESLSAMNLISQARTRLMEAQDAYNRGDYESAYALAASVLSLIDQAMWVEKSYQAEKTRMLLVAGAGLGVVAIVISLLLLRKRIRKTHGPLLSLIALIGLLLSLIALIASNAAILIGVGIIYAAILIGVGIITVAWIFLTEEIFPR